MTKTCKVCRQIKPTSEFIKAKHNSDGLGAKCKLCFNTRQRQLYPKRRRPRTIEENAKHQAMERKRYRTISGWVAAALHGCKQRKDCSLVKEDILTLWDQQNGLCAVTKQPMDVTAEPYAHNKPSIDRISNIIGYHVGNVRLVWHFVNQAKNRYSDGELLKYCQAVLDGQTNTA